MGSIVLQAASEGKRLAFPHSWIMIHEPAKWAGWQSTTAAAQHLERLKQMQDQIYKILSSRSGKPLRQIIKDTKRTDFYLDAQSALDYGLIDAVVAGELPAPQPAQTDIREADRARRPRRRRPRGKKLRHAAKAPTDSEPPRQGEPHESVALGSSARAVYHRSLVARDTLIDFFSDLSRARGEFLVYDDGFRSRTYTYEEVGRAARGFAARLHAHGLRKGDKVVFWSENRPEWIVAFWGCLLGGVVVVPIDYRASPDFLARVARIVAAKLVLVGQDVPPLRAPLDGAGLEAARARLARRASRLPIDDHARRRRRDHLHLRRDGRAERRRHHAPERAGEHRAGRARGAEVPQVGHGRSSRCAS